jgi:hypothetical protein
MTPLDLEFFAREGVNVVFLEDVREAADLNGDGKVDCADLPTIKSPSFGRRLGEAGFDPRADVDRDGVVDIKDWAVVFQQVPAAMWAQCR